MSSFEIRQICSRDEPIINNFNCHDELQVEDFLKTEALKLHESNLVRTHLLLSEEKLVGYFSLFADHVTIPKSKRKKEEWSITSIMKKQMYPSVRLHFMGIDINYRNKGFGRVLLLAALDVCAEFSSNVGCTFVNLEALNDTVGFYEKHEFVKLHKQQDDITKMILKIDEFDYE